MSQDSEEDLCICSLCSKVYDDQLRKPKFMPGCAHTFCMSCIQAKIPPPPEFTIVCPQCKRMCDIPSGASNLETNKFALEIIKLQNNMAIEIEQCYCFTCKGPKSTNCDQQSHTTVNFNKDATGIGSLLLAVLANLEESVVQRENIKEILVSKLEENDSYLKRMREVISSLREDRNLFSPNLPASFIKLNLLQSLQASKLQLSEATDLLDRIYEAEIQVLAPSTVLEKKEALDKLLAGYRESLPTDLFSRERLASSITPLSCKDLTVGRSGSCVFAVEIDSQGKFMATTSDNYHVVLWSFADTLVGEKPSTSKAMQTRHTDPCMRLAISSNNEQVFSSEWGKLLIHDVQSGELLNSYAFSDGIMDISMQPNSLGNVFALPSESGTLRLFDLRIKANAPVVQTYKENGSLYSAMFSPVDPMMIAIGTDDCAQIIDIRSPSGSLHSFLSMESTRSVRFNRKGDRLLCLEDGQLPVIYSEPTRARLIPNDGKIQLTAPGFKVSYSGFAPSCFIAGHNDDVVVTASNDNSLFLWSVQDDVVVGKIEEPLLVLAGHKGQVNCIRYSGTSGVLVSSEDANIVKMWTPSTRKRKISHIDID